MNKKVLDTKNIMKIMGFYTIVNIFVLIGFYFLVPYVLNYPPDSVNNIFQIELEKYTYDMQYTSIFLFTIIFEIIVVSFQICLINNALSEKDAKQKLYRFPINTYITKIFIPTFGLVVLLTFMNASIILIFKFITLVFTSLTLAAIISFLMVKNEIKKIIVSKFSEYSSDEGMKIKKDNFKFGLSGSIFMQIIPMFSVAILMTSLIGYVYLTREKADVLFYTYKAELEKIASDIRSGSYSTINEIFETTSNIERIDKSNDTFLINQDGIIIKKNGSKTYSKFFIKYIYTYYDLHNGRAYEYYGVDEQAAVLKFEFDNQVYYIGIKFHMISTQLLLIFILSFLVLFAINSVILFYFSKSLSTDIKDVARSLRDLIRKSNKTKTLPITSDDEIGELESAFNEFQKMKEEEQNVLVEREKMLSIGQFIGGIAHNLKTPIFALSGNVESLSELIKEYKQSIYNDDVTRKDHEDIAIDMMAWVLKASKQIAYMNDVISTIKDQVAATSQEHNVEFSIDDLIKRVRLITTDSLRQHNCILDEEVNSCYNEVVNGSIVALVQVITNMIANSIDAYANRKGIIEIRVHSDSELIYISVKDYAGGIKDAILNKIFKEMYTSKGAKGTGLGLYISYTTIKSKFDGDIKVAVEKGISTEFVIEIPKKQKVEEI